MVAKPLDRFGTPDENAGAALVVDGGYLTGIRGEAIGFSEDRQQTLPAAVPPWGAR